MNISLFSLLALTWKGGEEMQPVIAVTEKEELRGRRSWQESFCRSTVHITHH